MKITIIGPDNSKLLQDFLNGKHVSFKDYKIFVDDAYKAYLERKKEGSQSLPLHDIELRLQKVERDVIQLKLNYEKLITKGS